MLLFHLHTSTRFPEDPKMGKGETKGMFVVPVEGIIIIPPERLFESVLISKET